MKYSKQIRGSLVLATLLVVSACGGGGGGSATTPAVSSATDVTVERGKVYDARVVDSSVPPQTAIQKSNLNVYTFAKKPTYPVMASGGWIDVNDDGVKDAKDVNLDITLRSYSNAITPVTSYLADTNETVRKSRLTGLKDRLNANGVGVSTEITEAELLKVPSEVQNFDFVVLVNAIYKDMKENGGNLDSSDENTLLTQFDTVRGLTISSDPKELEAAVMSALVGAGNATYIPESELPDENTTTPDNNATVSSEGIYVATSNETVKTVHKLSGSPLLYGSKAYMRLYRGLDFGVDIGMKVLSYDLSQFNTDMNLSDMPTNILYEQVGPNTTDGRFNQRYYDIAEAEGYLYFATLPQQVALSQNSLIKHDLDTQTKLYHVKRDPVMGEHLNTTFDLARGWFLPFNSGSHMGIVEAKGVKVIDTSHGSSYKYGPYDYYGGSGGGDDFTLATPAGNEDRFFYAEGNSFKNISYLSSHTHYGSRLTHLDAEYKVNEIFADFNASYSGSKPYDGVGQTAPVVLDGEDVYVLTRLTYDDDEGFELGDLYLIVYGVDSVIKSTTLLEEATQLSNWNDGIWETYKYKDTLYFKYRHNQVSELCAYNLTTKSFTFRHNIENNYHFADIPATSYIITGDTIIMPENIARADENCTNNPRGFRCYDLAFKVLDISDGTVLKTIHHKDLDSLRADDNDVEVRASLSDENAVYFFGLRKTDTTIDNLIIKIDTPLNSVQKSRNRFDNHLTGVVRDTQ